MKKTAANPDLCMDESDENSIRSKLASDVMSGGSRDPQYTP